MKATSSSSPETSSLASAQARQDANIPVLTPLLAWWGLCDAFLASIPRRLLGVLRRYQARRLQKAIQTYSFEKHVLSRYYRPVVSKTLMRVCRGEVETNKFPFHVKRDEEVMPIGIAMNHRILTPRLELDEADTSSRLEFYLPLNRDHAKDTSKPQLR